jgi:hypothetical protein
MPNFRVLGRMSAEFITPGQLIRMNGSAEYEVDEVRRGFDDVRLFCRLRGHVGRRIVFVFKPDAEVEVAPSEAQAAGALRLIKGWTTDHAGALVMPLDEWELMVELDIDDTDPPIVLPDDDARDE